MAKERTVCDRLNLALAQIEAATAVADGPVKKVLEPAIKAMADTQQIVARIKRNSKYWGQTNPNQWFDVRVVSDASYRIRGNGNNYRLSDVVLGVRLDDGSVVDLGNGKRAA